jgi:hypothetical protein
VRLVPTPHRVRSFFIVQAAGLEFFLEGSDVELNSPIDDARHVWHINDARNHMCQGLIKKR